MIEHRATVTVEERGKVFKETVLLRPWESITRSFGITN